MKAINQIGLGSLICVQLFVSCSEELKGSKSHAVVKNSTEHQIRLPREIQQIETAINDELKNCCVLAESDFVDSVWELNIRVNDSIYLFDYTLIPANLSEVKKQEYLGWAIQKSCMMDGIANKSWKWGNYYLLPGCGNAINKEATYANEFYRTLKKLGAKETDDAFFETVRNN